MKFLRANNPASVSPLPLDRLPGLCALLALLLALTGCVRTRSVNRTIVLPNVMTATLEQLQAQTQARYEQVQSMSATVEITATTGGEHRGEVKELPSFTGYIILRKPMDLHILMLVPLVRTRALEMVSDGRTFRLYIPSQSRSIEGLDAEPKAVSAAGEAAGATPASAGNAAANRNAGLYALRPKIIRDALQIAAPGAEEYVTLTESSRITPPARGSKESVEEPDYDLTILRTLRDHTLQRVRVIHIGRVSLLPYRQEIYDANGRVVTMVDYSKYAKIGEVDYPMSILISRPLDEYTLRMDFTKVNFNQKVDDEQFVLKIPENVPVQKMP